MNKKIWVENLQGTDSWET